MVYSKGIIIILKNGNTNCYPAADKYFSYLSKIFVLILYFCGSHSEKIYRNLTLLF